MVCERPKIPSSQLVLFSSDLVTWFGASLLPAGNPSRESVFPGVSEQGGSAATEALFY